MTDRTNKYRELAELSAEIARCGRCGFCQSVCPVYQVSHLENSVARGRNMFAKGLVSGTLEFAREDEAFFTDCLLCRACVEVCFSGVRTDEVALAGRRTGRRLRGVSPAYKYVFERLLTDPDRLGARLRLMRTKKDAAFKGLRSALGVLGWLAPVRVETAAKKLEQASRLLVEIPESFLRERLAGRRKARGKPVRNAVFFVGCGTNFMFPETGEASIALLEAAGYETHIAQNVCCGLPAFAHGALGAARNLALKNLQMLSDTGDCIVVTDCSSCASFLKDYPKMLSAEGRCGEELAARAEHFSSRVRDIVEILGATVGETGNVSDGPPTFAPTTTRESMKAERSWDSAMENRHSPCISSHMSEPFGAFKANAVGISSEGAFYRDHDAGQPPLTVTFHDPCHLSRHQNLSATAQNVLRALPSVDFLEMNESDWCCGGAGAFAVEHPDLSVQILQRKLANAKSSGAAVIATTCPSCIMQLRAGLATGGPSSRDEAGTQNRLRVRHLVEIVRDTHRLR